MLFDAFEERVDVASDVFCAVFFDDAFEGRAVVVGVVGDLGGSGGFEEAFDAVEVVLEEQISRCVVILDQHDIPVSSPWVDVTRV